MLGRIIDRLAHCLAAALALAFLLGGPAAPADDLCRFLPADGNNVYPAKGLLRSWPAGGPRELWRAPIGLGKSAVLEVGGRIYTATQTDMKQYALCLDPLTGKEIWKHLISPKDNHHQVKGPVTSPVVDGDRVYYIPYENKDGDVYDLCCPVFCLRTSDGSEIWSERGEQYFATEASTPLIVGNTLYIAAMGPKSVLVAVDKMTGKLLWKVPELNDAGHRAVFGASSSLTYQVVGGIPQVIVSIYRNDNMGVHAATGEILWHRKFPTPFSPGLVSTPVAIGSRLFMSGSHAQSNWGVCLEMKAQGGKIEPKVAYISDRLQCNTYHTVSIVDGAVYGFGRGTDGDALQCTDFATGKLLWQQEGPEWSRASQLTVADGLIFALNKRDELLLAEVSRTGYKELGRVDPGIKMGFQQQPTIVNGRLYLRGEDTVVCYQVGAEPAR